MKFITRNIQRLIVNTKAEEFFVNLRRRVNFIRRFIPVGIRHKFGSVGRLIPESSSYPKDDCYFLTRDNTHFKINRSDYVQWRIFYGVRDNALVQAKKNLSSDSIVLDIGANFGAFSLRLATYAAHNKFTHVQIHAFEPNPIVFENYKNNLALNPALKEIVYIHPVGLGNETRERMFEYPDYNTGVGRVLQEGSKGQITVKIQRLDDFVEKLNPSKISFIKMIVEGFEPEVFKGGWNTLKKFKPPVYFEVTKEWYEENNSSIEEIVNELESLGYTFMGEYYNELIPYNPSKFSKLYQFNLLAKVPANQIV